MFLSCFSVVEVCLNRVFRGGYLYGESPWFLRCGLWRPGKVDGAVLVSVDVNVVGFME